MLELKNLYKTYSSKNGVTHRALENVSLKFDEKGLVFILGKSGSGKSTLLNLIGGLDTYDRGEIIFNGKSFSNFKNADFDYYRNSCVGFVFQDFNLLNNLSVADNVSLALELQGKKDDALVLKMLSMMKVDHLKNRKTSELSGGQKQRVAIARALIKEPSIILADEPTGSLDSETSDAIISILKELAQNRLVIVVTHNKELAYENGDRIIEIRDGYVLKDLIRKDLASEQKNGNVTVSSNLVILPKDSQLNDDNINDFNNAISLKRQDYYLLVEQDKRRVMSLFPNVKEVIDGNNQDAYVPYVHQDNKQGEKEFKPDDKSNLPLKRGIKFGLSNLRKKKLKLVFTILLSMLAVLILGCASNFTNYSLSKAVGTSMSHESSQFLEVSSSFSLSNSSYTLTDSDISYIDSLNKKTAYSYDSKMTYYYSTSTNVANNAIASDNLFLNRSIYGYLAIDDISSLGYDSSNFKVIYEKEDITEEDYTTGVYISSVIAETIVYYDQFEKKKFSSITDLLGTTMRCGTNKYQILGIYDIDENESLYHHFEALHTGGTVTLLDEYNKIAESILLRLVVKPSFMTNYIENRIAAKLGCVTSDYLGMDISNVSATYTSRNLLFNMSNYDITNSSNLYYFFDDSWNETNYQEKVASLKENQIFVGRLFLQKVLGVDPSSANIDAAKEAVAKYNAAKNTLQILDNNTSTKNAGTLYAIDNVEIVGIVYSYADDTSTSGTNKGANGIYVSDELFKSVMRINYRPNTALLQMENGDNYTKLIQDLYNNGYTINNEFVSYFISFASLLEKFSIAINAFAVIWFIITALLLYSFMSGSVKANSPQIGVLKALGANTKDIYKIYTIEALFIGTISTLFGVLLYYFGGLLVNQIITDQFYTFYFTVFMCEPITIIEMIVLTFIVLFVALIIPISKVKNIKPIEVMNSNN